MNHNQLSDVSECNYLKINGIHPIVAFYNHAVARCPLNLPVKNVLPMAKHGLQPCKNPSAHNFNAMK
jgi:hypothetical protein